VQSLKLIFETERLYIELYRRKHIRQVVRFYIKNAEALKSFEPERPPEFFTYGYHKKVYRHDRKEVRDLKYLSFILYKKENRKDIIGLVNFCDISFGVSESCRVGYKVDEHERNKGYMQEALKKLSEVMFGSLGLHRIEANVMPTNIASVSLLKKLGFVEEGYGKKYLKINGEWKDHIHFTLLNEGRENADAR
jgi:[ribosomal protein S5]-alanine N-acetyltransferase